ncbi:MAG: PLP-dependent aminotransferase family protein [Dehalococcoidia bacterium]|nr:PLP-dependent aminotransferase family protein [Dehalococcoidia bacterium]
MTTEQFWDADQLEEVVNYRARALGPAVWAAAQPDPRPVISFAGGVPDVPSLPGDRLLAAARVVIDREQREALQYGGAFGPMPLREAIAERSSRIEDIPVTAENVIIASGSAHGIGMVCETLLDPGDTVVVESPNFPGSLRTIRSFGAHQVAIPMDSDGMRVDVLEKELQRLSETGVRPKFIYCIPTHQNPAGCTMPQERREKLLELAQRYRTFVLEDDAYGELWYDEPPPPSIFSLSNGDHGVKVCTFSKTIATGLRLGWVMGPPALISRIASVRYDMGSSPFLGRTVAEMIRSGALDEHVEHLRDIYRRKRARAEDALRRYCGDYCTWQTPNGGFFLWLKLNPGMSARDVQKLANDREVLVGQGPQFFVDDQVEEAIRLSFSYVPAEDIEEGIHRLGEAMAEAAGSLPAK